MSNIFTMRYLMVISAVLVLSSAFSYKFLSPRNNISVEAMPASSEIAAGSHVANAPSAANADFLIDQALEFSLNGAYDESFPILKELADKDVTRAKLYLAVAYYHGHGTAKDKAKAKSLLLELQHKNYEMGIVNTYLNLIAYSEF